MEAYASIRPLSRRERELVALLCRSNSVLPGLQWLHWLLREGRTFDQWDQVAQRMFDCLDSMQDAQGASM